MTSLEFFIDGASQGNPGPSGVGVVVIRDGETVKSISEYIGETTNNVAEYTALLYALQEALLQRAENITINTDSQLLYRQLRKEYRVKHPNITPLYRQAVRLIEGFQEVTLRHIPREQNSQADKLSKMGARPKKAVL